MPRAKVRDEDRLRARRACIPCKTSKVRCDANEPCNNCTRKNAQSSCRYLDALSSRKDRKDRDNRVTKDTSRLSQYSKALTSQSSKSLEAVRTNAGIKSSNGGVPSNSDKDKDAVRIRSTEHTSSRMLLSSKGEKVYIGKIASLSLLQFLRQTVQYFAGSSSFTDMAANNVMLEVEIQSYGAADVTRVDAAQRRASVSCFFEASAGLLDMYTKDEIASYLSLSSPATNDHRLSPEEKAALYLIIAIGSQCRGQQQSDAHYAAQHFLKGRILAFEGMLCDPSINMIRIFLLMAFYMLGACRRNAAFMYLGVASKAACALGLHARSQYLNLPVDERDLRERTWKSLYILDTLVNSILGRPSLLPSLSAAELDKQEKSSTTRDKGALDAAYGACVHIAAIVPAISKGEDIKSGTTEDYLQTLGAWGEKSLPSQRRFTTGDVLSPGITDPILIIGNTHAACMYYFAVILATRPFLLSHLIHKLRARAEKSGDASSSQMFGHDETVVSKLAQVCLDAASYMSKLCKKTMDNNGLLNNMCILKALMFASGLLLGFSMFVDGKSSGNEQAFHSSQAVLAKFATVSQQARHYCETLHDFEEAITKYQQQQLIDRRRRSTNQYVRQVFSIEMDSQDETDEKSPFTASSQPGPFYRAHGATGGGVSGGSGDYYNNKDNSSSNNFAIYDPSTSSNTDAIGLPAMGIGAGGQMDPTPGSTDSTGFDNMLFTGMMLPIDDIMNMPSMWDNLDYDWQSFNSFPDGNSGGGSGMQGGGG